jgi:hypothetical protein
MSNTAVIQKKVLTISKDWLSNLSLSAQATELHIQRLFGFCAALTLDSAVSVTAHRRLKQLVTQLQPFDWMHYTGDPIFALAVHRMLARREIFHQSLNDYYLGCKRLSLRQISEVKKTNNLFFDLCSKPSSRCVSVKTPLVDALMKDSRSGILKMCRTIMVATSCGLHKFELDDGFYDILPKLCCSFATDWDLAATCILARTCAYLGLATVYSCHAARSWLLDQQRSDGCFGLLIPKNVQSKRDDDSINNDFLSTIDVLWTLAEMHNPGFMLCSS